MDPERIGIDRGDHQPAGADLIVLLGDYVAGYRTVRLKRVADHEWAQALSALQAPLGTHAYQAITNGGRTEPFSGQGRPTPRRGARSKPVGIPVYENDAVRLDKGGQAFGLPGSWRSVRVFLPFRRRWPDFGGSASMSSTAPGAGDRRCTRHPARARD